MAFDEEVSDFENELKGITVKQKKKKMKKCHYCEKTFDIHKSGEKYKSNYRCDQCKNEGIIRKTKFKQTTCSFCGIKFVDTYYTKRGLCETKTKRKKCETCRNTKIPKGPLPRPKCEKHECDICGKVFRKKINIYNHMDAHRSDVCCRVCSAKFSARSALRSHLRSHFETFICDICGFTTNLSAQFRKHKKIHEGVVMPDKKYYYPKAQVKGEFTCEECGIVYETKVALFGHTRRQHSENGVNGYTCKVCGDVTYRMKEYRIHALSHSSKPLLFCHYPGCNIFYDRVKPLNKHIKNVHRNTDEFSCDVCQKTFKYKASVEKHQRNNRCIPLKQRNHGKDAISMTMKKMQNLDPEELERIAKIAKEQYLEVRGSITVFKEISDHEEEEIREVVKIEQNIVDVNDASQEDYASDDHYDNFLDISGSMAEDEPSQDVIKIEKVKKENDEGPFVKIEIKTEPDVDTIGNCQDDDDWGYFPTSSDDILGFKNDPDMNDIKTELPMNPFVSLERLDYSTIMKWIQVKTESDDVISNIKKESTTKKMFTKKQRRVMLKMRQIAFDRRIKGEKYQCDMCDFESKTKKRMERHFVDHKKDFRKLKHACGHCSETFPRLVFLREHERSIHNVNSGYLKKEFICDLCGKASYTLSLLRTHLKLIHYSTKDLHCSYCPLKFKTKMYLERHESDVHLKIYRFPCQYCGKLFKRKHQLKVHEFTHSVQPEECKVCGKMVKVMSHHMKYVHAMKKKPKEKTPCPNCGKEFTKSNLQLHIERTHLKLSNERTKMRPCHQCDATFTRVDDLRRHDILVHFQGPVKKCPYEFCDAIFKKTKPLNLHIKNHHNPIDHYCDICGKKFTTRSGLLKHSRVKGHKSIETNDETIETIDMI